VVIAYIGPLTPLTAEQLVRNPELRDYGVEVKNTLPYIRQEDFETKKAICAHLGLRPIFAVRMMPKTWIYQLKQERGYALILKSQYYPWGQKALANRVARELGLPVVCVAAIEQGLIDRLLAWHGVNRAGNSPQA
jgi:hypothetical protein